MLRNKKQAKEKRTSLVLVHSKKLKVNIHKLQGGGQMVLFAKPLPVQNSEDIINKLQELRAQKIQDFKSVPAINAGTIIGYIIWNFS